MRKVFVLFLLCALGLPAGAASFSVRSDGTIGFDALLLSLELDASFVAAYADDAFATSLMVELDETGLAGLTSVTTLTGAGWKLSWETVFDVANASFSAGVLLLTAELGEAILESGLVREGASVGLTAELVPRDAAILHEVALGLNVDAYGRIQTGSCGLAFTYAAIEAGFACECADVTARATFTLDGFSELVLSAAGVGGLALGIQFGAEVRYTTAEKTHAIVPSLMVEEPNCFDVYLGLVWDAPANTLEGISVYGLGLACEIAGVRVRGLWEVDPAAIALVKTPYWALIGLVWEIVAPCDGTGEASFAEASIAFFFDEQGLFDLGEILFGLEWPIAPGWTASLAMSLKTSGGASFVVGWTGESR